MKTVVITRPLGDEQSLTDLLHAQGFRVIHEPLTEIMLLHTQRQVVGRALLAEPDAVLLTSRHGAQAFALLTELRDPFLLCVGEATADVALSLGFSRVSTAGGTVQKLIDYIGDGYDEGAQFLYISGDHVRADLPAILGEKNMQVTRIPAYEASASPRLSDTLIEQLRRGQIDAISFMSPRAAQIFTALLADAKAGECVRRLRAFCLSDAVAQPLREAPWRSIHVAQEATLASMTLCIDNVLQ